jgi:Raf kinase inhibitor-like YbhB/YbcL family protein
MYKFLFAALLVGLSGETMAMKFGSNDFADNTMIPKKLSCEGEGLTPELHWSDVPKESKSLAIIVLDPDSARPPCGVTDHWVVFNIPVDTKGFPQGMKDLPAGTKVGNNVRNEKSYRAPCPPKDKHHYFYRLYALDTVLDLPEGATRAQFLEKVAGHVLAEEEFFGLYQKEKPDAPAAPAPAPAPADKK